MSTKRKPGGRLNAVRDGIFAKELVITCAGESQEEFDRLRSRLWSHFSPQDVEREMTVEELAITYWRLQRLRRCEAAEIRKQTATARYRKELEKVAQLNAAKNKFFTARYRLHFETNLPVEERLALERTLAETRRSLESTVLGVEFLIKQLKTLKREVKVCGYLRPHLQSLLLEVCGLEADHLHGILQLNQLAKNEMEKLHPPGNQQRERNGKDTVGQQYSQTTGNSEISKLVKALCPPDPQQEEEGKVQLGGNDRGEQVPGNTADKNANSLFEVEKIAREREFMKVVVRAMETSRESSGRMINLLKKENTTETGMGADGGGKLFEALDTRYQEDSEILEALYESQEKCAEDDEISALEKGALDPVGPHRFFLSQLIDDHIELFLKPRKKQLELLEAAEQASEPGTLLLLPQQSQDRIHRAEVPLQRYLLKILDRLSASEGDTKKP